MKKYILLVLLLVILIPFSGLSNQIRRPAWDGKFYPADAEGLSSMIDQFLAQAQIPKVEGKIKALIVPHAAYRYSGRVAAHSYKLIKGKFYETVVVLAPSHHYGFKGCSIYPSGFFETPLGRVKIDEDLAREISENSNFDYIPNAHYNEHSSEVQIPFIQKVLPGVKVVPIIMGYQDKKTIKTIARALAKSIKGKNVLLVASTDMSHYHSKDKANKIDKNTISLIKDYKCDTLIRKIERGEQIMCGGGPVVAVMLAVQYLGKAEVKILKYGDSSDTGGSPYQVVGYLSAAIISPKDEEFTLTKEEKEELLKIARKTIESVILKKEIPQFNINDENLEVKRGAFVTIKKDGRLRGCIGFTDPILPLYQAVMKAAIFASTRDPRFLPLSPKELSKIEIEISVLTPLEEIENINKIIVGKHGLLISKNGKRGLLLPQVPVENNWDRITFLNQICYKAGLPRNCWRKNAHIYVFEAIVFGED